MQCALETSDPHVPKTKNFISFYATKSFMEGLDWLGVFVLNVGGKLEVS